MKSLLLGLLLVHPLVEAQTDPVAVLQQVCVGLKSHAPDVVLGMPVVQAADMTTQRQRGWKTVHAVAVTVSKAPSARVAGDFKAAGQQCQFDVSMDMKTVAISKRPCMALCKDHAGSGIEGNPYLAYFGVDGSRVYMK